MSYKIEEDIKIEFCWWLDNNFEPKELFGSWFTVSTILRTKPEVFDKVFTGWRLENYIEVDEGVYERYT